MRQNGASFEYATEDLKAKKYFILAALSTPEIENQKYLYDDEEEVE